MEKDFLIKEKYKVIGSPNESVFYNGKSILCLHKNWIEITYKYKDRGDLISLDCWDCGDSYFPEDFKNISGFCVWGYSPKDFFEIQKERRKEIKKNIFKKIERIKGYENIDLDNLEYYKYE